jgi:acetyl esterase
MVWLHGGGWVTGGLETADVLAREACASGMVVVSVDYRLAPESPFPAAVEDSLAALSWTHAAAEELGGDPRLLVVGGDSAGGNLAAVLAQQAGRMGVDVAAQVLLYPVIDLRPEHGRYPSRTINGHGPLLTTAELERLVEHYVGPRMRVDDPRASPIRSPDLSHVAPAVVVTAGLDPLRDEGEAYVEALRAAGVTVRHHRADALPHCAFDMLTAAPLARAHVSRALGDARALIEQALHRAP